MKIFFMMNCASEVEQKSLEKNRNEKKLWPTYLSVFGRVTGNTTIFFLTLENQRTKCSQ